MQHHTIVVMTVAVPTAAVVAVVGDNWDNGNDGSVCLRPSVPKPGIQHDRRGRGVPTLT